MANKLRNRVEKKILEVLAIASEFCPNLSIPEVRYNIRGSCAGECSVGVKTNKCILRFNPSLLGDYPEHFINNTVPHEVAHYVTHISCGNEVLPHGPEWKTWMKLFGIEDPQVTHPYQILRKSVIRPWLYKCKCRKYFFTTRRHNLAKNGRDYYCKFCNGSVEFVN